MGVVPAIARVSNNIETATKLGEFCEFIRHWAGAQGVPHEAMQRARAVGATRVAEMFSTKTAVSPQATGSALTETPSLISAFLTALRSASAFDAMLGSMRRTPARTRVVAATSGATGFVVNESQLKPLGSLSLTGFTIDEFKAVAIVPATVELAR